MLHDLPHKRFRFGGSRGKDIPCLLQAVQHFRYAGIEFIFKDPDFRKALAVIGRCLLSFFPGHARKLHEGIHKRRSDKGKQYAPGRQGPAHFRQGVADAPQDPFF